MMNNPIFQMMAKLQQAKNPFAVAQQMAGGNQGLINALQQLQSKSTPQEKEQFMRNLYQSRNQNITQTANQFGLRIQ
jgi:hypothetical protein